MKHDERDPQATVEVLSNSGLLVSFVYGVPGDDPEPCWSVQVLNIATEEEFKEPFAGRNLEHCAFIAETEARLQGWIRGESSH